MTQPDSIVPDPGNPQAWNRYAYSFNNPLRYTDPTGHKPIIDEDENGNPIVDPFWRPEKKENKGGGGKPLLMPPPPHNFWFNGWQTQITLAIGFPTNIYRYGERVSFAIFYGISFVTDAEGGFQIFGLTRDIKFSPSLQHGPAEIAYPTDLLAANITAATGPILGEGFAEKYGGTNNYAKQSVDQTIGAGPFSFDWYESFDSTTGQTNGDWVRGYDIGVGIGSPVSVGSIALYAHPLTPRFDFKP